MRAPDPAIDRVLHEHIVSAHVAPGATACVARFDQRGWRYGVGAAGVRSRLRPERVTPNTFYDLASVTKPVFAITLARLHDRGVLHLDEPLGTYLPWLRETRAGAARLDTLLAHRAGLAAHLELFESLREGRLPDPKEAALVAARAVRDDCRDLPEGAVAPPLYSDLGYILLGRVVEEVTARPLDDVVDEELADLGIRHVGSARKLEERFGDFSGAVAPTEVVPYRGGEVLGAVHDDNAWALSADGMCGHAGLFGTAAEVAGFGAWMIDLVKRRRQGIAIETAERLLKRRPGGTLRAGFDGKNPQGSSAGMRLGPETFGHLGFTGTSLWCDPEQEVVVVLLTNRVSPTRENPSISRARPLVHDALLEQAARGEARPPP